MAQLADIIGVSRQTAVLAFQFGDGLSNIFWPTADIVIICGLGGISLQKWYKWFTPLFLILFVTQAILLGIAMELGSRVCLIFRKGKSNGKKRKLN